MSKADEKKIRIRLLAPGCCIEGDMESIGGVGEGVDLSRFQAQPFVMLSDACFLHVESHMPMYSVESVTVHTASVIAIMSCGALAEMKGATAATVIDKAVAGVTVDKLMTRRVLTVRVDDDVKEAFRLMMANRIRHLPVVDKHRLVGLVSERDLRTFLLGGENMALEEILVPMIRLKTIKPGSTVAEAAALMLEHKISCLPVLDKDKLAGLVTETDLMKFLTDILRV